MSNEMANRLNEILEKTLDKKNIFGIVLSIESDKFYFTLKKGNLNNQSQFFIGSATKLFTAAVIMKLCEQNLLNLDDKISKYLSKDLISSLHIYKGIEYSSEITIKHLLSHTSGLPDYFQQKQNNGQSLYEEIISGKDKFWSYEDVIEMSKKMSPKFKPGEKGKAFYSDTNYQILGKIIEVVSSKSLEDVYKELINNPLELRNTYLFYYVTDNKPIPTYYKNKQLLVPQAMSSFRSDGGIVSTSTDLLKFIKAFFNGEIFPKDYLTDMMNWNKIFFPFEYGLGIMRFKLPKIFSPFKSYPELIGHSGLSGAFAFHCPELKAYLTGSVNQVYNPSLSFRLMLKILDVIKK